MNYGLEYLIIVVILIIIASAVIKSRKKDFRFEINKLIEYLGGKDNIISAEDSGSRLKVTLKDVALVNKDAIQKLGARGIVEMDNQLKIVYGKQARELKKYIEELKKL